MPTAEEILASLTASADEEEQEEQEESPGAGDNAAIKAVRKSQREWERKAKALAKEVEELSAFKAQVETGAKVTSAEGVLKELGLSEKAAAKQSELFLKVHEGEVTPESVKQFALDYGLVDEEADGNTEQVVAPPRKGFEPGGAGGTPVSGAKELMDRDTWESLYFRDKDAAMRVVNEGKLDLSGTPLER